jgi:ABC-type transport system involved in multi-copper enzyme maturation permease subunit
VTGLLRKDLAVFVPRDRLLIGLVYLLGHPMVLPNREAFFWLGVGLAVALVLYVPAIEWHQESERMLSSLPIRRSSVVVSRYLSSILACGLAALAWVSTGRLLSPLLSPLFTDAERTSGIWATFEGVLSYLVVVVSITALFLPLYFRFGLGRGAVLFAGCFLALLAGIELWFGPFLPGHGFEEVLSGWTSSIGPGWVLVLVLVGLGLLVSASGRLSVGFFRRRDL